MSLFKVQTNIWLDTTTLQPTMQTGRSRVPTPRCDVLASSRWETAFLSALLPADGARMSHHLAPHFALFITRTNLLQPLVKSWFIDNLLSSQTLQALHSYPTCFAEVDCTAMALALKHLQTHVSAAQAIRVVPTVAASCTHSSMLACFSPNKHQIAMAQAHLCSNCSLGTLLGSGPVFER